MKLYDKNTNLVEFNNLSLIYQSDDSRIYTDGSIALKLFDGHMSKTMDKKIFEILKDLKIKNLVELYEYYYTDSSFVSSFFSMDGYSMKYINDEKTSLVSSEFNDLEKIIEEMEYTLNELSNYRIRIRDAHEGNIIFTKNGFTIIDVDKFIYDKKNIYSDIYKYNKEQMIRYINYTISRELLNMGCGEFFRRDLFHSKNETSPLTYDILSKCKGEKILNLVMKTK